MNLLNLLTSWRSRWRHTRDSLNQTEAPGEPDDPFPEPIELEITDVFDLHTIPPKQVKAVVEEYLILAHACGFPVVRLIHGKGRGTQRAIVRAILQRTPFVIEYHDAPPAAGGWGATIAELESRPLVSARAQS